ncbi:MAG: endonuclease MutS2 [Lachnospiraceae bacterium]|nr:endonuclease MutS2 [Lachnospiraceae bacterium]
MNEKVLHIAEFHKIIEELCYHASSAPGKARCRELLPMTELYDIELAQSQTQAAFSHILRKGSVNFGANRDFSAAFASLSIGASLSQPELLHLAAFLENVARVRSYGLSEEGSTIDVPGSARADKDAAAGRSPAPDRDPLADLFSCLYPVHSLSAEIRRCILSEEDIADDASSELRRIRRSIGAMGDRVHAQLTKMMNVSYASYLQDSVITMRGDRYCLPVRAEYKSQVPGIVHDQSSSGSTYFIEPAAIVELGNELRQLTIEETKEIERILATLSAEASEHLAELKADAENMTALDFIFARGGLAHAHNASRPVFNTRHYINIRKGRHPLIDRKTVVPVDLAIGEDYSMIIITGPNTGGKTVTLKTVGLFELMGMAGLHIPAGERSELSVFREIYADIGDEQSIEQSLSTFSSHMVTIVDILKQADDGCLCLFDELGAGTDPAEGAALAISILNYVHERGATCLATTHYSELKVYAMRTDGVVNASCEFDVETLRPTYRLMVGIPGKSNAFAISKRLGVPDAIIDAARAQLSQETQNFEDILDELEANRRTAARDREEAERIRQSLARKNAELEKKNADLAARRDEILRKANEEARDILQAAKQEADEAIAYIRKYGGAGDLAEMERARADIRGKVKGRTQDLSFRPDSAAGKRRALSAADLKIGDKVLVVPMGMTGTVHSLPDKDGKLTVTCGIMQTRVQINDLAPVAEEETVTLNGAPTGRKSSLKKAFSGGARTGAGQSRGTGASFAAGSMVSPELNLLGMTTADALEALDKYLDDARLAHLNSVRIVHGKGTGALRSAVQQYLRRQKWASFRDGEFGEGDAGVTIVTFR